MEHRVGSEHEHGASDCSAQDTPTHLPQDPELRLGALVHGLGLPRFDVQRLLWQGLPCDTLEGAEAWMAAQAQLVGSGVETSSRYGESNSNRDYDNDEDSKTDVNETELASNNGGKWCKEKPERRAKQWSQ